MTVAIVQSEQDPKEHLRQRVRCLDDVLEEVSAERTLSMFLAWRRGVSIPEIAETIREEVTAVEKVIASYERDEDAESYEEGPRWVALWPNQGWSPTF